MKRKISALKITRIRLSFDVKTLANMPAVYTHICSCINVTPYNNKTGKLKNFLVVNVSVNDCECEQYSIIADTWTVCISFSM